MCELVYHPNGRGVTEGVSVCVCVCVCVGGGVKKENERDAKSNKGIFCPPQCHGCFCPWVVNLDGDE